MAKDAQNLLKSYGSTISQKELQDFESKGYGLDRAKSFTDKSGNNAKFGTNATEYYAASKVAPPPPPPLPGGGATGSTDPQMGYWTLITESNERIADITGGYQIQAAQIGANATVSSAGIRADADKYIADAYAGAQRYGSELALEGTKYTADKEAQWREAVANIETQGRLDLQPIINAGLENVANIEAAAQRDVADITGRYNVEGIATKGKYDKEIGKMQLAGSMYGLLNAAFG
jgi:hypothetical protein